MKTKHALLFTAVSVPVCIVLRILQYIFVIDENGFYQPQDGFDTFIIYMLYIFLAAAAVFALFFMIFGSSQRSGRQVLNSNAAGFIFILIAIIMMADFGVNTASMLKMRLPDPVVILELLTAVFYAVLGYTVLSGSKPKNGIFIFGFFAPVYVIAYTIKEFFGSFEKSHVSQVKFNMLTLCALALFVMTVVLLFCGQKVTKRRVTAISSLYAVTASSSSAADLFAAAAGKIPGGIDAGFILNALIQTLFIVIAFIALIHADDDTVSEVENLKNNTINEEETTNG